MTVDEVIYNLVVIYPVTASTRGYAKDVRSKSVDADKRSEGL